MADRKDRISARLSESTQKKAYALSKLGYGPTELVKEGIDLLYEKAINSKPPSIPALLARLTKTSGEGPNDLSTHYKKYYRDTLIEKHTG